MRITRCLVIATMSPIHPSIHNRSVTPATHHWVALTHNWVQNRELCLCRSLQVVRRCNYFAGCSESSSINKIKTSILSVFTCKIKEITYLSRSTHTQESMNNYNGGSCKYYIFCTANKLFR